MVIIELAPTKADMEHVAEMAAKMRNLWYHQTALRQLEVMLVQQRKLVREAQHDVWACQGLWDEKNHVDEVEVLDIQVAS